MLVHIGELSKVLFYESLPMNQRQDQKTVKFKKISRTTTSWDIYTSLAGLWEHTVMDNIDEEYNRFVHHLSDCSKGAESLKTTTRRLSPETLELAKLSRAAINGES
ncbi:unnamed protein product [Heligmosomoides polygyrus]|uniref:PRELI/MSF1 domain-containing protein n=1 Tax=Heligmosomoides polygyrus TaxID=6339 RepID=A0A183F9K5_HELPZ|nr:unnamed protein product [Heligmosomoides polygyrus]